MRSRRIRGAAGNVKLYPENIVHLPALHAKEIVTECHWDCSGLRMRIATALSLPHAHRAFSCHATNRRTTWEYFLSISVFVLRTFVR